MTGPVGARVTPRELATAAGALRTAAGAVSDSLVHTDEPSMANPEPYGEVMFGPATQVAAQYARLTRQLAEYVAACADRLRAGEAVFAKASVALAQLDTMHGKKIGNR